MGNHNEHIIAQESISCEFFFILKSDFYTNEKRKDVCITHE